MYVQIGRNDWKYWFDAGRACKTSTDVQNALQALVAALPSTYHIVICSIIPQLPPVQTDPYGIQPESLADYRAKELLITGPNVTIVDASTFGIDPAVDLYDGVHELAVPLGLGVSKNLAGMRASVGV